MLSLSTTTCAASDPLSHVLPHRLHADPLFTLRVAADGTDVPFFGIHDGVYSFYLTNHMFMTAVAGLFVILAFGYAARRVKSGGEKSVDALQTRGTLAQLFETLAVFVREEVARPNLGHLTDRYIKYIWSVFFLILFANLLGLVPFGPLLRVITGDPHLSHWGGTATSNLALNGMLALCSFVMVVFVGIRETGLKPFLNHFNPLGWEGVVNKLLLGPMLFALEWMGLVIKSTVLAMRLFGTMMAGHLVIAVFIGLIHAAGEVSQGLGYGVGVAVLLGGAALTLLELFIAMLQAFIFTFLTVIFVAQTAVHDEHEHDEPHEDLAHEAHHGETGAIGAA